MRLIDAEWIRNMYADFEHYENRDDWTTPIANVLAVIDDAPTIDAVSVVRCGECKNWKGDGVFTLNALGEEEQLCKWWSKFGTIRTANTDFCSYGERRDNE